MVATCQLCFTFWLKVWTVWTLRTLPHARHCLYYPHRGGAATFARRHVVLLRQARTRVRHAVSQNTQCSSTTAPLPPHTTGRYTWATLWIAISRLMLPLRHTGSRAGVAGRAAPVASITPCYRDWRCARRGISLDRTPHLCHTHCLSTTHSSCRICLTAFYTRRFPDHRTRVVACYTLDV